MRVSHLTKDFIHQGEIGLTSLATRFDDNVRVDAKLSEPAYCYLVAFDPDGKEEMCYPDRDGKVAPQRSAEMHYPLAENRFFSLTDGVGLQVFVLAVSRQPLPAYQQWRAKFGPAPWQRDMQAEFVWRYNDKGFQLLPLTRGPERGPSAPPKLLQELCNFFKDRPGIDAVQAMAFPVKKKVE